MEDICADWPKVRKTALVVNKIEIFVKFTYNINIIMMKGGVINVEQKSCW